MTPIGPLACSASDRPKATVAEFSGVQSCFYFCSQGHSQWVTCLVDEPTLLNGAL